MTVQDDVSQLKDTIDALSLTMAGGINTPGAPVPSTSAADWQTITQTLAILSSQAQFANSNDYAALVNAIQALQAKWDGAMHIAANLPAQIAQLQADAAAAATPTVIAPFPPAPTVQPPGVVVVPGTSTTTTVAPGFTGGQTAAVGLVGAALGLGAGYLMWKSPHRVSNPRRRRHRKVSEASE
jgi:hypothetical protein